MTKKMEPFPGELTKRVVERPFKTKTGRDGCQRVYMYALTDGQKYWLCRWFPVIENTRLMKASGMTHGTLHRFARQLGLKKSEKGLHGIMKRQAKLCRKINEASGYYDSLRGKPPSEASRAGTARMWQEIREGKREHPFRIMAKKNPRKYRQYMARKSESRKELIRKELLRVKYGLPRQTRLSMVVNCKYTTSQKSHRYNAANRGYILAADRSEAGGERYNIYYNDDTERSEQFENNLRKDGFRVLQWDGD